MSCASKQAHLISGAGANDRPKRTKRSKAIAEIKLIRNTALEHMCHKAGAIAISNGVYDVLRSYVEKTCHDLVKRIVILKENNNIAVPTKLKRNKHDKKIITVEDIEFVLSGTFACPFIKDVYRAKDESLLKRCKVFNGKDKMRFYQKQHDCLYLSKSGYAKIVKALTIKYTNDPQQMTHWSRDAIDYLQMIIEEFLIAFTGASILCMIHAHRRTLKAHDFDLAYTIASPNFDPAQIL